jgi:predicted TPR repeat methyltransferase
MSTNEALQLAIAAHKEGRLLEAEVAYERVLNEQPAESNALNFLGMLRFHQGKPKDALELLQRSVEANPGNPHGQINLGNLLLAGGADTEALAVFTRATELAPELSLGWYNLGVCLRRLNRPKDAVEAFSKAIEFDTGYEMAHDALAQLFLRMGRLPEALDIYRKWLAVEPDNPIARHMAAAISGASTPARADDEYVRVIFDHFAESFDLSLAQLEYRAPKLLTDALAARIGSRKGLDVLDAGCGTGLCGPMLRPAAQRLVGVDLSSGMVSKARPREVYDELVVQELCEFMRSRPGTFDVVLSADTLVYFGALGEAMAAARACLREGGFLAFTLENLVDGASGKAFHLQPHGRYCHAEWYVRDVLAAAGFGDIVIAADTLRNEGGKAVAGHVVTAVRAGERGLSPTVSAPLLKSL